MSLKNDIEMVKEELNSEEKFFEKAVITERFVKKYKNLMIGAVVIVVLAVGSSIVYDINKQNHISSANKALSELQQDSTNKQALADLKASSKSLYNVWTFSQAIKDNDTKVLQNLKNSADVVISDLATYALANDEASLNDYALKQNSIYKDFAVIQNAILLMKESKIDEAQEKLLSIPTGSSLSNVSQALRHYGAK